MRNIKFVNKKSVRFRLHSFSVPINLLTQKKNTIYTKDLHNLLGDDNKLTQVPVKNNYGFTMSALWYNYVFTGNDSGIYISNESLQFQIVTYLFFPVDMIIKNDRLWTINSYGNDVYYSVDLSLGGFVPSTLMEGTIYLPAEYGKCKGLSSYKDKLLLICEKALLTVGRDLKVKFLTANCGAILNNLLWTGETKEWGSDWFGLGYATDTQRLKEVFVKTNCDISLKIISNQTQKTITVTASSEIQKIKTNLRGDMFKILLTVPNSTNIEVSDISAVISYGRQSL
jgi:hypothetical protein